MTPEHYALIERGRGNLTDEEKREGWHFCPDWDFTLVGPEGEECTCEKGKI